MNKKIVIRTPNHLGDCIMAMPMICDTKEAYSGATLSVLVPENLAEIFMSNPDIDDVLKIPSKYIHGLISVTKIKDIVSPHKFDIGYILPPSFGSAASMKLAGVKERIGYIADGRRLLLTKPLALPSPLNSQHRSEHYYNLLRRGAELEIDYHKPKLFLNDDAIDGAVKLLGNFGVKPEEKYMVIAFKAVAESRRWGIENYSRLSQRIVNELNYKLILTGVESDFSDGEIIVDSAGPKSVINLAGKTNIMELAAICSMAKLFIGNDSGPAHLAAAVGVPILVLSGADDPNSTSPMANKKEMIYLDHLDCISCIKNKCPLKEETYMRCMTGISVDQVYQKVIEITN